MSVAGKDHNYSSSHDLICFVNKYKYLTCDVQSELDKKPSSSGLTSPSRQCPYQLIMTVYNMFEISPIIIENASHLHKKPII